MDYARLRAYRESIGAPWFREPFDLNLIVARSGLVGQWDDLVLVAFTDDAGNEIVEDYTATGDAWEGEWIDPGHPQGCIYTIDQHVPGGLELGLSKGRPALRQRREFRYVRWPADRATVPEVYQLDSLYTVDGFSDLCHTHIHGRVSDKTPGKPAFKDSVGCTVLVYAHEFASLIRLVQQQKVRHGSGVVSPTYCKLADL